MRLQGTPAEIMERARQYEPTIPAALENVLDYVPFIKRQIAEYQGAVLLMIALKGRPQQMLEIGTAWGFSAACLAEGAGPDSHLTTLNPKGHEVERARRHLAHWGNVELVQQCSWDYLEGYDGPELDLIFVDGDHDQVERDLPWFNRLRVGGLMLFHDYSPAESGRPTPVVFETLNKMRETLGREFDISIIDHRLVGMVGFRRKEGESWHPQSNTPQLPK